MFDQIEPGLPFIPSERNIARSVMLDIFGPRRRVGARVQEDTDPAID